MIDIREHGGIYADGDGGGGGGTSAGANIPGNTTGNIYGFKEDEKMSPYLKNSFNVVAGENIKKGDMIICKDALFNKFNVMTEFVGKTFTVEKDYTVCDGKLYYHDYKNEKYVPMEVPGIPSVNTLYYFEEYKVMLINGTYFFKVSGTSMTTVIGEPNNDRFVGRINNEDQILVKKSNDSYGFVTLSSNNAKNIVKGEQWPSWVRANTRDITIEYQHLMDSFVFKGKYVYVYPARANTSSTRWPIHGLVFVHFADDGTPEIVHIADVFFQGDSGEGSDFTDKVLGLSTSYNSTQPIISPTSQESDEKLSGVGVFNRNGEFVILGNTKLLRSTPLTTLYTGDGKFKTIESKRLSLPIGSRDNRTTFTGKLSNVHPFLFPPLFASLNKVTGVVVGVKVKSASNYTLGDKIDEDLIEISGISHDSGSSVPAFGESDFIRGIAMENASQGSLVRIQRIW